MLVDIAPELRVALGDASSVRLAGRLRRELECATCGNPLGTTMAALSGQALPGATSHQRWVLSVHHKRCQPSQVTNTVSVHMSAIAQYTGVTFTVAARRRPGRGLLRRRRNALGAATSVPVCVVNPSLDEMVIEPRSDDTFLDVTIEQFRDRGWVPMGDQPVGPGEQRRATCSIGSAYAVSVQAGLGTTWELPSVPEINEFIEGAGGLLVVVTHDLHVDDLLDDPRPSRLFADGNLSYCTWADLV